MILREMLVDDLDQVMEIEQDLFHVPWTKEGFFTFLTISACDSIDCEPKIKEHPPSRAKAIAIFSPETACIIADTNGMFS